MHDFTSKSQCIHLYLLLNLTYSILNQPAASSKILIVDDEPNIVLAIEFLLQRQGYLVEKAYNGLQALEVATAFKPDIIILDVMMPDMNGFEVGKQIRQLPTLEHSKIIFLTAKGTQKDKQTGYASGAEVYMIKPFDNDELVNTVQEMLTYG
jgi:two-component system alkaline phosphatase synthesis response regulator PhoP